MGKYQGGKNIERSLYVRVGGEWVEINALIQIEKEVIRKDVAV